MKVFKYITLRFSAIVLLFVVGLISVSSCQRSTEFTEEPYVPVEVLFRATVGSTQGEQAVDSRLTPPHSTGGGAFEMDDEVGLFLHNLNGGNGSYYSHSNHKYTADATVKFVSTPVPHYETYHTHSIYAYYPHDESITDAAAITTGVLDDQSDAGVGYGVSDFLAAHIATVVPKQKADNPILDMVFKHMMTSVVVNVTMADGSPLLDLTGVKIGNTFIGTQIDITKVPVAPVPPVPAPVALAATSHTLDTEAGVKDVTMWRYNKDDDKEHKFRAIVVPQAVIEGKPLIKVVFGSGIEGSRVFSYIPKVGDVVHTSGLVQGAEHVFNLSVTGTSLEVSGGEIVPWGSGIFKEGEITPGGETAMKMIFDVSGDASKVSNAELTIDRVTYKTVRVEHIDTPQPQLVCYYYMDSKWGYDFTAVTFKDESNVRVSYSSITPSGAIRIMGDPTSMTYSEVIAKIVF